ncbi:bifunctional riboflavin kinase/FAD synthetase [Caldalkalibacillus thermarum TA2.A1]|uniref:Riboflavin biosynthesis protein n=1 Tax=Caldalkalibacillus thermarum (strain TA2.A1) TaxID=986075 RepID=A0A8X8L9J2_CALTT|nr:bifunctional riboflavin kinase/FAD synthetase [Caldalkalibacillus thermarum]QZT32978.1 bifunctional riboflavin kinase/FAD synthetase [Caldalkalibacillus thermarum TA2.A1]
MKVYRVTHPSELKERPAPASVALGNFDGVHRGHQAVIAKAMQQAALLGLRSAVMTFNPHPKEVLGLVQAPAYLTPLPDKLEMLAGMGLDAAYVVQFTPALSKLTPAEFIEQYIVGLNIKQVVTGFDFRFGHKGAGDIHTLARWSREKADFAFEVVSKIEQENHKISSSRIRSLLKAGEVSKVRDLLSRPYRITGLVVHGDKRGRTIGFPTANIAPAYPYVIPRYGVYAVYVVRGKHRYPGVVNVGKKPTFLQGDHPVSIEVHLLDFNGDLYGETLAIEFIDFLRSERKFESIEALRTQIESDIRRAHSILLGSTNV